MTLLYDSVAVDIENYTMKITDKMTISELKDLKEKSKNTMHLVYGAEHYDEEEKYDPYFMSWHTIYRNMDITGTTKLEIIFGDEYYQTFGDEYDLDPKEDDYMCLYNDYGQIFNGRQFFKKDYNPELTKKHNFY